MLSRYQWDATGVGWYEETRDSGANFFFEQLPVGQYTFKLPAARANLAGVFRVGPATVQSMYAPELTAYSARTVSGGACTRNRSVLPVSIWPRANDLRWATTKAGWARAS